MGKSSHVYFDCMLCCMWTHTIRSLDLEPVWLLVLIRKQFMWNQCRKLFFPHLLSHLLVFCTKHAGICSLLKPRLGFFFLFPQSKFHFLHREVHLTSFMVEIAMWIALENLPWGNQMVACNFLSVLVPLKKEDGGQVQSHPAWKNRPLPQKDKGRFWPHKCWEGCNCMEREREREDCRHAALRGEPLLTPVEIT